VSPRRVLVLGGVRAGKSAFAVARARAHGGRVVFVATAEAGDDEMAARIARHRAERPAAWRTVEVPVALPSALTALEGEADIVVVDCLNLWVANLLHKSPELTDSDLSAEAAHLEAVARRPRFSLILVSNEVGWGIHPETELGRRFRDALGLVNQAAARAADEVVLMVAGCPLVVKSPDVSGPPGGDRLQ
jgi:adenosylcobinamide kinase / adenosylcobinamide-phosphate guanylyltransferase